MRGTSRPWSDAVAHVGFGGLLLVAVALAGCAGSGGSRGPFELICTPFGTTGGSTTTTGPGSSVSTSGSVRAGARASVNPCSESQTRKFVRISMRNLAPDYVHYFLILVAYVNGTTYPNGAVCPSDIALYTQLGYNVQVAEGQQLAYGNYCIKGPALIYFYRGGQFQGAGAQGLASAIAPAQGTTATYDSFFGPSGQQVPVPDWIIFHNPGIGDGARLKVSFNAQDPCASSGSVGTLGTPNCQQDAFYYVDETDVRSGSTVLGAGSFRRVPDEIQGTGCTCGFGNSVAYQQLAPSGATAASALCNEFLRAGRIDYVFLRDDTDPPFPQLVWRVTDAGGGPAQSFDPRAGIR